MNIPKYLDYWWLRWMHWIEPKKEKKMIKDDITIKRIETIHPKLRAELRSIYEQICIEVNSRYSKIRFSSVLRTQAEQDALYAKGRTAPGNKVTWTRNSYHIQGCAVDIVLVIDKDKNGTFETASWDTVFDGDGDGVADWLEVVKIFNSYGWQWGLINSKGKRYDLPHFQKTFGYTAKQLKNMPRKNGYPVI